MLKTEMRNPKSTHIDKMSTLDMLQLMQDEYIAAVSTVQNQLPAIAEAVDIIAEKMVLGGRLIYIGCGTSGRLGVLDAAECPPTFGVGPDKVIGIIAGGDKCLRSASENDEDSGERGISDLNSYEICGNDVIAGISAAGGAAYVTEALRFAKAKGSTTIGITSNADSRLAKYCDIIICTDTGAEVITGSTRMKAGTAHKTVLNMLSSCAMIKQGYVYENMMINLKPANKKLKDRSLRITCEITGLPEVSAQRLLDETNWNIRKAAEIYFGKSNK